VLTSTLTSRSSRRTSDTVCSAGRVLRTRSVRANDGVLQVRDIHFRRWPATDRFRTGVAYDANDLPPADERVKARGEEPADGVSVWPERPGGRLIHDYSTLARHSSSRIGQAGEIVWW
jgi:hypothetical protein